MKPHLSLIVCLCLLGSAARADEPAKRLLDLLHKATQAVPTTRPQAAPAAPKANAAPPDPSASADAGIRPSADGHEVTDTPTGLIWRRCAEGQSPRGTTCAGTALVMDHTSALTRAAGQAKAGGMGWRLPDAEELKSIADERRFGLAIDTSLFPATPPDCFWTSFKEDADNAKSVNFYNGFAYGRYHTNKHHLRLARGGTVKPAPVFR
jgi:hypothetical protein